MSLKFKRKVRIPKIYCEDKEQIDGSDVKKLLLSYNDVSLPSLYYRRQSYLIFVLVFHLITISLPSKTFLCTDAMSIHSHWNANIFLNLIRYTGIVTQKVVEENKGTTGEVKHL